MSASITDDSLAAAAGALLLLVTTHVALARAPTRGLLLAVGGSIAVGLLAKETDLPLVIVLAGVVAWRWRHRLTLADSLPIGMPIALIAGWWYVRNLVAFHRPLPPLTPIGVPPNKLRTVAQLRTFVTQSLRGLFSPERYQGSPLTLPVAGRLLIALVAVVLAGLVVAAVVLNARTWSRWDDSHRTVVVAYARRRRGSSAVLDRQRRAGRVPAPGALSAGGWRPGHCSRWSGPCSASSATQSASSPSHRCVRRRGGGAVRHGAHHRHGGGGMR